MHSRYLITFWAKLGLFVWIALPSVLFAADGRVLVGLLVGGESQPYDLTRAGVSSRLLEINPDIDLEVVLSDGSAAEFHEATTALIAKEPELIIALGLNTIRVARSIDPEIPVVAALVLRGSDIAAHPNITGIELDIPLTAQLEMLQSLLPSARSFGMLYNPESNQEKVDEATRLATSKGFSLVSSPVSSPTEIPVALRNLVQQVDVIWGITDSLAMSSRTAKPILIESFRRKVPVMGPASSWTRAGAFCAVEWDYEDMGRQSAELAWEIIEGKPASSLPIVSPRKVGYSLNLNTADQINIQLEDDQISKAARVYD